MKQLSPFEAAGILNLSAEFVVNLIENGELPARKSGPEYILLEGDVLSFRQRNLAARRETLSQLVAQAQELEMGY